MSNNVANRRLAVGPLERTYIRVAGDGNAPGTAAILLLHGSNQTGAQFRKFSNGSFDELTARGATLAYLDGYKGGWNDARLSSTFAAKKANIDDTAFVASVIDDLVERDGIDPSGVFVAGYSAGGSMVVRLIHELPELLSGAALISAAQAVPANFKAARDAERPLPVTIFHGTSDAFVKYEGGIASLRGLFPRGEMLSARATAEYFAHRNGIDAAPTNRRIAPDISELEYAAPGTLTVRLLTIDRGGHTVPGGKSSWFTGRATQSIAAARVLADEWGLTASLD